MNNQDLKQIGIVILNYKSQKLTRELSIALSSYSCVDYVVIVDNNSNEDFYDLTYSNNKIIFIKNSENSGYAKGNNIGLRWLKEHTKCEFAFIANPDVFVEEKTIFNITQFLYNNADYAVASSKRYDIKGKSMGQYWNCPNYKECVIGVFSIYANNLAKKYAETTTKSLFEKKFAKDYVIVDVVPGAFFGMNLSVIAQVGYLDEHTFLYYEENILAKRLDKLGYKRAILINCEYQHNHVPSKMKFEHAKSFIKSKNWYAKKYLNCGFIKMAILHCFNVIYYIEFGIKNVLKSILKKT